MERGRERWEGEGSGREGMVGKGEGGFDCIFVQGSRVASYATGCLVRFTEAVGRSGSVAGEMRKPLAYSVTEHSFPGGAAVVSACSPLHHLDLRDATGAKLSPHALCSRTAAAPSPSPGRTALK